MRSIIKSHFHRGKTGFCITGIFIILSTLMMIVGLSICFGMDNLYVNARDLSNSPDCAISIYEKQGGLSQTVFEEMLQKRSDVQDYDIQTIYYMRGGEGEDSTNRLTIYSQGGMTFGFNNWVAMNIDDETNAFRPKLRNTLEKEGNKFYFTGNYLANMPVQLGDEISFMNGGRRYTGYVAGIYDDMTRIYETGNIYVCGEIFRQIADLAQTDARITEEYNINIRLASVSEREDTLAQQELLAQFSQTLKEYNVKNLTINPASEYLYGTFYMRETFRTGTRSFIMLLGTAMVAFSILVAVIVAIVIAFLVRSSILDEVRNLGVWKSLGYTTAQLRLSYLAIYGFIGCICMTVGVISGISLMPTFVGIITNMARLDCSKAIGTHAGGAVISILFAVATVAAVVYASTARVKSITPLSAMRRNIAAHSFKRNRAPLDNSKIPLSAHLGIKSIIGEPRRSVMVAAIILIMSLICSFVGVIHYNLKVDQTAIINMSGIENADFYLNFYYEDPSPYYEAVARMDGFEAREQTSMWHCQLDGENTISRMFSSFERLRTKFLSKGRYPIYPNEVLIEEKVVSRKGLNIGDTVTVSFERDGKSSDKSCVIVGYYQNLFDNGGVIGFDSLLLDLYSKDELDKYSQNLIYFEKDKVPTSEQIHERLKEASGGQPIKFNGFSTGRDNLEMSILNTVETAADAVLSVFFLITAIIISLLLVMLIKVKLIREWRNFAVYKALGYTTANIMTQISVAMVVLGALGSLAGAIVGALATSPILTLFGGFIGAGRFDFVIPWGYTAAIILCIPALIYSVSMLCSLPARRIRPAELL